MLCLASRALWSLCLITTCGGFGSVAVLARVNPQYLGLWRRTAGKIRRLSAFYWVTRVLVRAGIGV